MEIYSFKNHLKKVYSQFDQDGVLEHIFNIIGVTNKYFVEFGSNGCINGGGNTAYLRETFNMNGLLMDGSEHPYGIKGKKPDFERKIEFIKAESINELFDKYKVPQSFDFLSIDIDGEDYYVMDAINLDKFKPRVICIEINQHIPVPLKLVQHHNPNHVWKGQHEFGCSPQAMLELLNKKGYAVVAYTRCDLIAIDKDILNEKKISFEYQDNLIGLGVMNGRVWTHMDWTKETFFKEC